MSLTFSWKFQRNFLINQLTGCSSRESLFVSNPSPHRRNLLTIAIETSCDDTSVAVLEKHINNSATLYYNSKVTSDNRFYGGIHPINAHESHQKNLASLVSQAISNLPPANELYKNPQDVLIVGGRTLKKPDFVTVTRGPGMRASLISGLDTAKGLAVGWQAPLIGVNHMQAHALTPRLISALNASNQKVEAEIDPKFPFMSLLVSGGHTMLVQSHSIWNHEILANTTDISIGDMLDKSARVILPAKYVSSSPDVMYGRLLEEFAYPSSSKEYNYKAPKASMIPHDGSEYGYSWKITPPYLCPGPEGAIKYSNTFSFSGIGSKARNTTRISPNMCDDERRCLARSVMAVAFEHVASRVLFALARNDLNQVNVLVVSGGVASNKFLQIILRQVLDARGFQHIRLVVPSPNFCTDNAAMIAWTGMEMFEAGWSNDLYTTVLKQWSIDPKSDDGGILGVDGWKKSETSI